MALLMWTHGEEALAKSLVACKLYKAMAHEAADDDLDTEIYDELRNYAKEFENKGLKLLDFCYRQNAERSQRLLTCELQSWSSQSCLSLAGKLEFLPPCLLEFFCYHAHFSCCQSSAHPSPPVQSGDLGGFVDGWAANAKEHELEGDAGPALSGLHQETGLQVKGRAAIDAADGGGASGESMSGL